MIPVEIPPEPPVIHAVVKHRLGLFDPSRIQHLSYKEVLRHVDRLSVDERARLTKVLRRRSARLGRRRVLVDIREADRELAEGSPRFMIAEDIMNEVFP